MVKKKGAAAAAEVESSGEEPVHYERRDEEVHVDQLVRSPLNPRKHRGAGDEAKVAELADSITRIGVLDRLLVREVPDGTFEILAGESRWMAIQIAMVREPARAIVPVTVFAVPDDIAFEIAIASNDQRTDPHPLDQCDAFVTLRDTYGRSVAQIAAKVGRTPQYVYDRLRLEQLAQAGRAALLEGRISLSVALVLARIASPAVQDRVTADLLRRWPDGVPVHVAQDEAKRRLMVIVDAPFDPSDASLDLAAGPCTWCPKRSQAQQHLFGDLLGDEQDRCTDPECWDRKRAAAWTATAAQAADEGKRVATIEEAEKIVPHEYGPLAQGFVKLDESGGLDTDFRTWRVALGERIAEVTVTVVPDRSGKPIEVAKRAEMLPLVKRAGAPDKAPEVRDYGLEREVERRTQSHLVRAAVGAVEDGGHKRREFWQAFTALVIVDAEAAGADHDLIDALERRGITWESDEKNPSEILVRETVDYPDSRLLGLIVELTLVRAIETRVDKATVDSLLGALNVDRKHHERTAAKEVKAERKAKEKAVAKTPRKPKSRKEIDAEESEARREQLEDAHAG